MRSPGVLGRRTASPDQQRVAALPEGCAVPRQVLVLSEKDWRSCCLGPGASPKPVQQQTDGLQTTGEQAYQVVTYGTNREAVHASPWQAIMEQELVFWGERYDP